MSAAPQRPAVTPEMLATAQVDLERMEAQVSQLATVRDSLPESVGLMFDAMESMFGQVMGGSIERQRETVKMFQAQLDGKTNAVMCECHAALMEDGSTNHGPLNPYAFFYGTREECDAKARECGWAVNGDEHKCPECAANV